MAPGAPRDDDFSAMDVVVIVAGIALTAYGLYLTRNAQIFLDQLMNEL